MLSIQDLEMEECSITNSSIKTVQDSINPVKDFIFGKENKKAQGITSWSEITVSGKTYESMRYIGSRPGIPAVTKKDS